MKKLSLLLALALVIGLGATTASAADYTLHEWTTNVNGAVTDCIYAYGCGSAVGTISDLNPLGSVSFNNLTGTQSIGVFFDYGINEDVNGFYNEYGQQFGALGTGETWQIDEPGWNCDLGGNPINNAGPCGTIWNNLTANPTALNNGTSVTNAAKFDTSFALAFNLNIPSNKVGFLAFTVSNAAPNGGFYLGQFDTGNTGGLINGTNDALYLFGNLTLRDAEPGPVPEPASILLIGSGLAALAFRRRWLK